MALRQSLCVGIRHDELDTLETLLDHVVDSISARTANPEDRDPGLEVLTLRHRQIQCHVLSACRCPVSAGPSPHLRKSNPDLPSGHPKIATYLQNMVASGNL
jgi:hypothetical protein